MGDFLNPQLPNARQQDLLNQQSLRVILRILVPQISIAQWPEAENCADVQVSFYSDFGLIPGQKAWATIWGRPMPPHALAVLTDQLADALIICKNAPEGMIMALNTLGLPYLDMSAHPAHFAGNTVMGIRSNIPGLRTALAPYLASDGFLRNCASVLSQLLKKPKRKTVGKRALFVCQPSTDSERIANGHYQLIEDFADKVFALVRQYDEVIVIQDGQRDKERTDLFLTQLCPKTVLSGENFYDLLINDKIAKVYSISSPRTQEAGYFGTAGENLGQNSRIFADNGKLEFEYLPVCNLLSQPIIWQDIFSLLGINARSGNFARLQVPPFNFDPNLSTGLAKEADDQSQDPAAGLPREYTKFLLYMCTMDSTQMSDETVDLELAITESLLVEKANAKNIVPEQTKVETATPDQVQTPPTPTTAKSDREILDISGIAMEQYQRDAVLDFVNSMDLAGKLIVEIGSDWKFAVARALLALGASQVIAANPWFPDCLASPDERIIIHKSKLEDLAMRDPVAEMILGIAILEHADTPGELARKCHSLLKPGGYLWLNGAPVWTCNVGHHIYLPHSDKIQGNYFFYDSQKNPWASWEHLSISTVEQARQALTQKGLPAGDIEIIADSLLVSDFISRKTPTEIFAAFREVFDDRMQEHRIHDAAQHNAYYDLAKNRFSEEDLQSYGIVIKARK